MAINYGFNIIIKISLLFCDSELFYIGSTR